MDIEVTTPLEATRPKLIRDTVTLPLEKNEFIHIQADHEKLAQAFTDYAPQFGIDKDDAKSFFENKVDIQFGEVRKVPLPGISKFDQVLGDVIGKLQGSNALGVIAPNGDRYTFCLDIQAITKALPNFKTRSFSISDYQSMTLEERISGFEQAVKSLTEHEFFHLVQFMKNPQELIKSSKQVVQSMRLLFAYTATSLSAVALFPHDSEASIMAATPVVFGAVVYLNKGQSKVEGDAYDAQKKALGMNLRNPYTFNHETG